MRMRVPSIAVAVVIGALAGCGSGSSSSTSTSSADQSASFKAGFESAAVQLKRTAVAVGRALQNARSQSAGQAQATFSGLADQWQSASAKLDPLQPPPAAASDFAALKSSAARVETDLNAITSAAASNDTAAAKQAAIKAITDILATKSAAAKVEGEL